MVCHVLKKRRYNGKYPLHVTEPAGFMKMPGKICGFIFAGFHVNIEVLALVKF